MKSKQFKKLSISDDWYHHLISYPNGFTILENLIDWVGQTNELINNVNKWDKYLVDFVSRFDSKLQTNIINTLKEWQDSGLLDVIISDALQTQITGVVDQLNTERINAKYPPYPYEGLKGDGTDETETFQNLMDLFTNGGVLYIPKGTYVISDTITIPKNVSIEGDGAGTKIESAVGIEEPFVMFRMSRNDDNFMTYFRNISFNQRRKENGFLDDQVNSVIIPRNNVIFENVFVENTVSSAIVSSDGVENIIIRNCVFKETGHHPIYFTGDNAHYIRNITIENNLIDTPATIEGRAYTANLIKFRHGSLKGDSKPVGVIENIFINNNIMGCCTDNSISIYFTSSGVGQDIFRNIVIDGNIFNYNKNHTNVILAKVYFAANSYAEKITISNNIFEGNTISENEETYGIRVLSDSEKDGILLKNNIIKGLSNGINTRNGFIVDNNIKFASIGILVVLEGDIQKNVINSSKDNAIGIYQSNANIKDNYIDLTGLNTVGIQVRNLTDKEVSNNTINATEPIKRNPGGVIERNSFTNNTSTNGNTYIGFNEQTLIDNLFDSMRRLKVAYNNLRPSDPEVGECIFDVVLKKPIIYNGSEWTDFNGQPI